MAILTYHHIGECPDGQEASRSLWVGRELFRAHLQWLSNYGWKGVTLDNIFDGITGQRPLPRRWVAITFDDGFRDNYLYAMPVLRDCGFPATVFMITGKLQNGDPGGNWDDYVSADEVLEMRSSGIEIGSHTRTHPRLTSMDNNGVRAELVSSRDNLLAITGEVPRWLSYPYGNFSPRIAEIARQAGYSGAVSTIRGNRVTLPQLFWMPRVMIMGDTKPRQLDYKLSWLYHVTHALKNRQRWVSLRKA